MSDISSAGITGVTPGYGKTCRKNVLRRVDIPVVPGAAGRARPVPRLQARLGEQVPAGRAGLARRVPAVDRDHVPSGPGRLVLDHAAEGAPPAVGDGLGRACGCGPCSSRRGLPRRSRRGRGPAARRRGAGNRRGRRGPSGGRGRPWPWPSPGSRSPSGSGPCAAGTGRGSVPAWPGSAGSGSSPRRW